MLNHKNLYTKYFHRINILLFSIVILFCFAQFLDYSSVHPIRITNLDKGEVIKWNIEDVTITDQFVIIKGWAYITDEEIGSYDLSITLENIKTHEALEIPTVLLEIENLKNAYPEEIDYSNSGFFSKVNKKWIGLENNSFYIYIKYFNNDKNIFVKTNKILSNEN